MYSKLSSCTVKYIDDASHAVAVNLKKSLRRIDTTNLPKPLQFHEHTGYTLNPEENKLQEDLNDLKTFTDKNLMIINQKKTHIMNFNFRTSLNFTPVMKFGDSEPLEIVEETKILGIMVSDSLRWDSHVNYMLKKAYKKVWLLRRLKLLKLDSDILLDFYCKEVRSVLEFGAPVWHSGLTNQMSNLIERIQKICIQLILGDCQFKIPYFVGCTLLSIEPP